MSNSEKRVNAIDESPLGPIPKEWKVSRVCDICTLGRGRVINQIELDKHPGIYPVYSSQSKDGGIFGYLDTFDFEGEYVTWTTDGAYAGTVFYRTGRFSCTNVCGTLKAKDDELSMRYLAATLSTRTHKYVSYIGNPKLMNNVMGQILIPIPPYAEQNHIAEILDTLDNTIQQIEKLIAKLKQIKAGLLHDLLTRGIDEHGQLRDPLTHPEQFKDSLLGRIPREWEVSELALICSKITDGCHQSVKTSEQGIPFLYVSCIQDGQILWDQAARITESTFKEISKGREPKKNLILYTAVGSYGHAALVQEEKPFSFQRHIAYILPDGNKVVPSFLVNWLNSHKCKAYADRVALGNAQKTVTLGLLSNFPIPLPSFEEQEYIVTVLNRYNARILAEENFHRKLKQLKKGLMQDLLTGQVRASVEEAV